MSVDNFEHVQNNRGAIVAKTCRRRSVVRTHSDCSKIAKGAVPTYRERSESVAKA